MAFVLAKTLEGYTITEVIASLYNSATVTADVRGTIYVKNVQRVISVVGYVRLDANNSNIIVWRVVPPNGVDVTAQSVPATTTTYFKIVVLGY